MNTEYLLDTHICLWAFADPLKLSDRVKKIIENPNNNLYVSQISLFEITIKLKINKLPDFNISLDEFIEHIISIGYKILPLKNEHLVSYANFPYSENHKDPFDRLLIATSFCEKIPIILIDENFPLYKNIIEIIW